MERLRGCGRWGTNALPAIDHGADTVRLPFLEDGPSQS
jgi:hypothetical protein